MLVSSEGGWQLTQGQNRYGVWPCIASVRWALSLLDKIAEVGTPKRKEEKRRRGFAATRGRTNLGAFAMYSHIGCGNLLAQLLHGWPWLHWSVSCVSTHSTSQQARCSSSYTRLAAFEVDSPGRRGVWNKSELAALAMGIQLPFASDVCTPRRRPAPFPNVRNAPSRRHG